MSSKYWDDFERRVIETSNSIKMGEPIKVRRVAVYITDSCNFRCEYCNVKFGQNVMAEDTFKGIVDRYGRDVIIHITGGEPSVVPWLYPFIEKTNGVRFHLNTNAFVKPPRNIQRLKISLDTNSAEEFDSIVHVKGAFDRVVKNIWHGSRETVTSITCLLSKRTYKNAPEFMKWVRGSFPDLYAVFFSCYKGDNPVYKMSEADATDFFDNVSPLLKKEMDVESLALFNETATEKFRIFGKNRFPENKEKKVCYLSLSERVFDASGNMYRCSHLYRDKIFNTDSMTHSKCKNGCNRRLVKFNEEVEKILKETK